MANNLQVLQHQVIYSFIYHVSNRIVKTFHSCKQSLNFGNGLGELIHKNTYSVRAFANRRMNNSFEQFLIY